MHHDLRCRLKDFCKLRFKKVPFYELILAIGLAVPVHPLHKFTVQSLRMGREGERGGREGRERGEGGKVEGREGRERGERGREGGKRKEGEVGALVNEST